MSDESSNRALAGRLKRILAYSAEQKKAFAAQCGVSVKELSLYLNGSQEAGTRFYRNLKLHYPLIDLNWLISGEGKPQIDKARPGRVTPMDLAASLVLEVESEVGFALNERQRDAVIAVLRRGLEQNFSAAKDEIKDLISAFQSGRSG